jgi:hypothetical protein
MFRVFFSITAAATAVARTFIVCVRSFIIFIFGRTLWRCSTFSSLLLDQLKEQRKKSKKKQKTKFCEYFKTNKAF